MTPLLFLALAVSFTQSVVIVEPTTVATRFPSGTLPLNGKRYELADFSIEGVLGFHTDKNVTGKIVLVASNVEHHLDDIAFAAQQQGAIGAILMTTQSPPGWGMSRWHWLHPVGIPTVDVYYTDFASLAETAINKTVRIVSDGNPWLDMFSLPAVVAFTIVTGTPAVFLTVLSALAVVSSIRTRISYSLNSKAKYNMIKIVTHSLLLVTSMFLAARSIDYLGMSGLFGYVVSDFVTYIPVAVNYGNILLNVVLIIETMQTKHVAITGFVQNVTLYVILASLSIAIGIACIGMGISGHAQFTGPLATAVAGSFRLSTGILYIVTSTILISRIKKSNEKHQRNRKVSYNVYNLLVTGIATLCHGILVLTLPSYYNDTLGNAFFYWLESLLMLTIVALMLVPFIRSDLAGRTPSSVSDTSKGTSTASSFTRATQATPAP